MSTLIKGMEMPTSCFYCPFHEKVNPDDYVCMALNKEFEETFSLIVGKRHKDCPLIPVPEHGRLIDADALDDILADQSEDAYNRTHAPRSWERALSAMRDYLDGAPTVIPASKEREG